MKTTSRRKTAGKSANTDKTLREHLVYLLKGGGAHVRFADAVEDFPEGKRGTFVQGLPHAGWQLLEHTRLAQWDILEFSRNAKHVSPDFPGGYWPKTPNPPNKKAWEESFKRYQKDLQEMIKLVQNPRTDLFANIHRGRKETILREALLIADHTSYHLGQMVNLRKALGAWPGK